MSDLHSADTRKLQAARLRQLADYIEKLDPHRLNMRSWAAGDWQGVSCGTAGCALGHAVALWPTLLKFKRIGYDDDEGGVLVEHSPTGACGFRAAYQMFGCEWPFDPWADTMPITPSTVAHGLRRAADERECN